MLVEEYVKQCTLVEDRLFVTSRQTLAVTGRQ